MNNTQQPEALRLAERISDVPCTSEEDAKAIAAAADELVRLHAENETLQAGYAAARLEIESLQARIKTMAEEHADELMVAHLDGRMRVAQLAGAQQPGTAYAALPDDDRDYMRKVVAVAVTMLFDSYKEDVTRAFSTGELSEFVTITAAMGGERVEDIYRRAWDLLSLPVRASHGQAPAQAAHSSAAQTANCTYPACQIASGCGGACGRQLAQAAPAAVEGCTRSHPHENMDSACRAKAAIAEMQNMAARGAEATAHDLDRFVAMLAAAPTPQANSQPAPAVDEREAFELWARPRGLQLRRNDALGHYGNIDTQRCWEGWQARAPADSVLEDAARLEFEMQHGSAIDAARKQGANHD